MLALAADGFCSPDCSQGDVIVIFLALVVLLLLAAIFKGRV